MIQNSLKLDDISAIQIMTPLEKVMRFPADMTVQNACAEFKGSSYSRNPIFDPAIPDKWVGLVMSRDILFAMANDRFELKLEALAQPLHCVPASLAGHHLLDKFLKSRSHLFSVVDEFGKPIGVVSLEDVIEEILGKEIVDEKEFAE